MDSINSGEKLCSSEKDSVSHFLHKLTKFIHGMSMLFVKGELHQDTNGWTDLVLHWRRH